jgi:hypothetical protein
MEKHLKKLLNRYEKLLEVSDKINSWFIETNRKYMTIEQDNYYLKWRSEYLEKWIKKNNPDAKLFKEDSSEYDAIKEEKSDE